MLWSSHDLKRQARICFFAACTWHPRIHLLWTVFLQVSDNTHSHFLPAYTVPLLPLPVSLRRTDPAICLSILAKRVQFSLFMPPLNLSSPPSLPCRCLLFSPVSHFGGSVNQASIMRIIFLIWGFLGNWRGQVIPPPECQQISSPELTATREKNGESMQQRRRETKEDDKSFLIFCLDYWEKRKPSEGSIKGVLLYY